MCKQCWWNQFRCRCSFFQNPIHHSHKYIFNFRVRLQISFNIFLQSYSINNLMIQVLRFIYTDWCIASSMQHPSKIISQVFVDGCTVINCFEVYFHTLVYCKCWLIARSKRRHATPTKNSHWSLCRWLQFVKSKIKVSSHSLFT